MTRLDQLNNNFTIHFINYNPLVWTTKRFNNNNKPVSLVTRLSSSRISLERVLTYRTEHWQWHFIRGCPAVLATRDDFYFNSTTVCLRWMFDDGDSERVRKGWWQKFRQFFIAYLFWCECRGWERLEETYNDLGCDKVDV